MKQYVKYAKPYLGAFIIGPCLMLTEVLGDILMPKMMSLIINHGVAAHDTGYILRMGLYMVLVAAVMAVSGIGGAYFSAKASISFTSDLRKELFEKVQRFSFKNIDDFSTGSLVTRLTNDVQQVQQVMMMGLRLALRAPGMLVGALIMAFLMNPRLALIILVVIPLLAAAIAAIMTTAYPRFGIMQTKLDKMNSGIQEALTNVRLIKSFVREDHEMEKFRRSNEDLQENSLRAMKIVIMTMPVMMLAMNITTVAVVWYGGNMIIGGTMQVGDLTAFTTYIVQILMSLMMLSMVFLQSARAMASIKRIDELMNTEVDLTDDQAGRKELEVKEGRIEFKDVSFSYDRNGEDKVLEHISFTAEPGQVVGIIGSTGSGKTSMVQLIPRLYDVTEGAVLVDGVDVREYSLKHLRNGVGMVLQKNVLFSGTILDNIAYGLERVTEKEVMEVIKDVGLEDMIEKLPDGIYTQLGEHGDKLSGGQRQRISIARALIRKPKIIVFDEATSALDSASEKKVQEATSNMMKNCTTFLVAHRLSTIRNADRIVAMRDGKIVEVGSYDELMEKKGYFYELKALQS